MFNNNFLLHLTNQVTWDHAKRDVAEGWNNDFCDPNVLIVIALFTFCQKIMK